MKSKNVVTKPGNQSNARPVAGHNMDGFFRAPRAADGSAVAPSVLVLTAPAPKQPRKSSRGINHAHAHKPETPKTLMRRAVKKPAASFKQQTNVQGSLQHKVPSLIAKTPLVSSIDPARLSRATTIVRSPHIARHNPAASHTVPVSFMPLPVQIAPDTPTEPETGGAPAPQPTNKPIDMFEHALANAGNFVDTHAHKAHFKKQAKRHLASMTAGTLALLVIAGFAAYQNTPGLQFKIASVQAGVATHMPNFSAAGFAYNGTHASEGKVQVGFSNNGVSHELTQQPTNWSDADMIQNISATDAGGNPNYSTLTAGNNHIYKLSNDTATWVSNGTWYQVPDAHTLNDSQLKALAANS